MHLIKGKKGFTLVEVIVSMAILALIAAAFVPLFGFSFTNIFSYGERDKAMSVASDIMEELYSLQPLEANKELSGSFSKNGTNDLKISDLGENGTYEYNGREFEVLDFDDDFTAISNEDDITGYKVTIEFPYKEGDKERHVTLTSFVRGEQTEEG